MSEYKVAAGLGPEYLRVAVEPPIDDVELADEIRGYCSSMPPTVEDGATVFFTNLPEGYYYHNILRNTLESLQKRGHDVMLMRRLGFITTSNNPFECERLEGVEIENLLDKVPQIEQ